MKKISALFVYLTLLQILPLKGKTTIFIEAENADTIYHATIDSNHSGFTGKGFVNTANEFGSYLAWDIFMPDYYSFELSIKYANGSSDREADIFLNNTLIQDQFNFPSTSEWTSWNTESFDIKLDSGMNTLKIVSANPDGCPNFDHIILYNSEIDLEFEPVALNDSTKTSINQPAFIPVLQNDYDLDSDSLQITEFTQPVNGDVQKLENQVFKYTPKADFAGIDTFSYVITDGKYEKSALVKISVENIDWSVEFCDMILETRTPASAGSWNYTVGLLMEGILRVYKRTGDQRYLNFVRDWASRHISANGVIDESLYSLDNMMPGFMLLHLYEETGIEKFQLALDKIRENYNAYPRTTDSAFWHNTSRVNELWLDGLYMSMPFYAGYAYLGGNPTTDYSEVLRQFNVYTGHLWNEETGILLHAYDEDGSSAWALPPFNRSPHHWGRSIGWVVMGLTEVIEIIPPEYPERDSLMNLNKRILEALAKFQNQERGLWYQVVDKGDDPRNWLESSCTIMYILAMQRAVQIGYLDESYLDKVQLGYSGVLSKLQFDENNRVQLTDICVGTGVSADINYYFNRGRITNDNHGMGSFLIMNELIAYNNFPWTELKTALPKTKTDGLLVSAYPNPANRHIIIKNQQADPYKIEYRLYGLDGKEILAGELIMTENKMINVSDVKKGMYILELNGKCRQQSFKIRIEK